MTPTTLAEAVILGLACAGAVAVGTFLYDVARFLRHRLLRRIPTPAEYDDAR